MGKNGLTLVVKSPKGQKGAIQSAESAQQRARWLMLADIALGSPKHAEPEPKHPGERALEEHKAVIRTVKEAAAKTIRPSLKRAA
jgi:hypothetical protein